MQSRRIGLICYAHLPNFCSWESYDYWVASGRVLLPRFQKMILEALICRKQLLGSTQPIGTMWKGKGAEKERHDPRVTQIQRCGIHARRQAWCSAGHWQVGWRPGSSGFGDGGKDEILLVPWGALGNATTLIKMLLISWSENPSFPKDHIRLYGAEFVVVDCQGLDAQFERYVVFPAFHCTAINLRNVAATCRACLIILSMPCVTDERMERDTYARCMARVSAVIPLRWKGTTRTFYHVLCFQQCFPLLTFL